jgi:putative endonuclease
MPEVGNDDNGRPSADAVRFYYVYILLCVDGKLYTGCTDNLKDRIERHNNGYVPATQSRLPVVLIFYFAFSNKYTAFNFEKYLKSGSGRAFLKKHLIIKNQSKLI